MNENQPLLTSESIQMLVTSVTQSGQRELSELEAERLLNAIARVQAGVATGTNGSRRSDQSQQH